MTCWNSLNVILCSVVICGLLDFGPSRVLANEPSYEGNNTVKEGDSFKITCHVSKFQVIKWQKDGQNLNTDIHYNISQEDTGDNMFVATISVDSALQMHSGAYRCTTEYNKVHVLSVVTAQINIKANYDYNEKLKFAEYKMKLILNCNAENNQDQKFLWKWFKEEHSIDTDSDEPHHVSVSGNTLTINRFVENDAGKYSCKLYDQNDPKKEIGQKLIQVILKPYVKLPKTATFLDGDKIEMECIVFGVPKPEISWKFENYTLKSGENVKFVNNKMNVTNAILVLDPITMKNRGNFYCIGTTNGFLFEPVMSGPSYVRIKDKMAAFWPFLGICAEVIILCLIIFVYENKRFKSEFEESDTDQGPETNNATEGGGDVRHRK